jgi:hypothetical protein
MNHSACLLNIDDFIAMELTMCVNRINFTPVDIDEPSKESYKNDCVILREPQQDTTFVLARAYWGRLFQPLFRHE